MELHVHDGVLNKKAIPQSVFCFTSVTNHCTRLHRQVTMRILAAASRFGAAIGPMLVVWQVRTHLVTCFVCADAPQSCRRLIRAGVAIPTGGRLKGNLLRAALSKAAALITSLPLVAPARLMISTGRHVRQVDKG